MNDHELVMKAEAREALRNIRVEVSHALSVDWIDKLVSQRINAYVNRALAAIDDEGPGRDDEDRLLDDMAKLVMGYDSGQSPLWKLRLGKQQDRIAAALRQAYAHGLAKGSGAEDINSDYGLALKAMWPGNKQGKK